MRSFLPSAVILFFIFSLTVRADSPDEALNRIRFKRAAAISFIENKGQLCNDRKEAVPFVLAKAGMKGADIYITEYGLRYVFAENEEEEIPYTEQEGKDREEGDQIWKISWMDMHLLNADIKRENIEWRNKQSGEYNYYLGNCPDGVLNLSSYSELLIRNVYPGIDWRLYSSEDEQGHFRFKYDFIVHPFSDPNLIRWQYRSLSNSGLTEAGDILVPIGDKSFIEAAPLSYLSHSSDTIKSSFISFPKEEGNEYSIHLENYDRSQGLIIDPYLKWGTIIGGSYVDGAMSADCDDFGNLYVCGYTASSDFPTYSMPGAYNVSMASGQDVFLMKFNTAGVLLWSTYYGGFGAEFGFSVHVNISNQVLITGSTGATNFPCLNAGTYFDNTLGGTLDAFIVKFGTNGARLWATYYGGTLGEEAFAISTDLQNNIWVSGHTFSGDFPVLDNGGYFDDTLSFTEDAFALKFDSLGTRQWASYVGGNRIDQLHALTVDLDNNMYFTGYTTSTDFVSRSLGYYTDSSSNGVGDAVIMKFDPDCDLLWSTYYGGSGDDDGHSIVCDKFNQIFVLGVTKSGNLPTFNAGTYFDNTLGHPDDLFLLKFASNTDRLWATYFGGNNGEYLLPAYAYDNLGTDSCGSLYLAFNTSSLSIPLHDCDSCYFENSLDVTPFGASWNTFVTKFSNIGNYVWGTYMGNYSFEVRAPIAIDNNNILYVSGESNAPSIADPAGGAFIIDTMVSYWDESFINQFLPISFSDTAQHRNACNCGGQIYATIKGEPPFSYEWSTGQMHLQVGHSSDTLFNLCPGTYSVTLTDGMCRIDTLFVTIDSITNNMLLTTDSIPACGLWNGSAIVQATGGTLPYSYVWDDGQTNDTAINLSPGLYRVIVEDSVGCRDSAWANVDSIRSLPQFSVLRRDVSCYGASDGQIVLQSDSVHVMGFDWTPTVSTADSASSLPPGTYQIHVYRLDNRCDTTITVVVGQPTDLVTSLSSQVAFCGGMDGRLEVLVSGGIPPYHYVWSNGDTTALIDSVAAAYYSVTISDDNFCTDTIGMLLNDSLVPLNVSYVSSDPLCYGSSDGQIIFSSTGAPVSYEWTPLVSSSNSAYALAADLYHIEIRSSSHAACDTFFDVLLSQPDSIHTLVNAGSDWCSGAYGNAIASILGGTSPYQFDWAHGSSGDSIGGLNAGTYYLFVQDSNGCADTVSITITDSIPLFLNSAVIQNLKCFQDSSGSILITDSVSYTYTWSPAVSSSHRADNLPAGTYTVQLNSIQYPACDTLLTFVLTEPPLLDVTLFPTDGDCYGISAEITATASGGVPAYQYSWNNLDSTNLISGLQTGWYSLTVTDANACQVEDSVSVFSPSALPNFHSYIKQPNCPDSDDGAIYILCDSANMIWNWIPAVSSVDSAVALAAGTYLLNMHLTNSICDTDLVFVLNEAEPLLFNLLVQDEHCYGMDGSLTWQLISGREPIQWLWSDASADSVIEQLHAGDYSITLTDSAGCNYFGDTSIENIGSIHFDLFTDTNLVKGHWVYLYLINSNADSIWWNDGSSNDTLKVQGVESRTYVACASHLNCIHCDSVRIEVLELAEVFIPTAFSPGNDGVNDVFRIYGANIEFEYLQLFNRWGELVFESNQISRGWNGEFKGQPQPLGVYVYVLKYRDKRSGESQLRQGNVTLLR